MTSSLFGQDDVHDVISRETTRSLHAIVRAQFGETAFVRRASFPGSQFTDLVPTPEAALKAAVMLRSRAAAEVDQYARRARAEGVSWDDIGQVLGLDEDSSIGREGEAFYAIAGNDAHSVGWTCTICQAWISDRGPFNSHPDDQEHGHAEGCRRHLDDIEAWKQRMNEYDDED